MEAPERSRAAMVGYSPPFRDDFFGLAGLPFQTVLDHCPPSPVSCSLPGPYCDVKAVLIALSEIVFCLHWSRKICCLQPRIPASINISQICYTYISIKTFLL